MSAADEAQARAYRAAWQRRMAAHATRERQLRGSAAALRTKLLNWQPLVNPMWAYPVGDEDGRTEEGEQSNG